MSDSFGAMTIPVSATATPIGDPGLGKIGAYLQAVVNAKAQAAWVALRPRVGAAGLPIKTVLFHNPEEMSLNVKALPALFLYRKTEPFVEAADGLRYGEAVIRGLWIFPPEPQEKQVSREPFGTAIGRVIYAAVESPRHPSWVDAGDTDPLSASVASAVDSLKLAVPTATTSQSYSGAALDGAIGGATMSPRLEPTVTTVLVATPAYNTADPIVVRYVNWYDRVAERELVLTSGLGGETVGLGEDVKSVLQIDVPAQLTADGSMSFGNGQFTGLGSSLFVRAALEKLRLRQCMPTRVKVSTLDEHDHVVNTMTYDAVELELVPQEQLRIDLTDTSRFHPLATAPAGADLDVLKDELLVSQAWLPDANG